MTVHLMVHAASSGPSIITCAPRLTLHTQKVSLQEKKWRCFTILLSEWRWFLDTVCHSCPLVPGCSQVMSDDGGVRIDSSAHSFSGAGRTDQRRAFNKLLLITWCGHAITQLVAPWQHNYWARPAAETHKTVDTVVVSGRGVLPCSGPDITIALFRNYV